MPFVKMVSEDRARSHGRVRVRILDEVTNKFVAYPSGRVRWFASEAAADDWIAAQRKEPTAFPAKPFRPRNYSERP
jgi:hypothetical protein